MRRRLQPPYSLLLRGFKPCTAGPMSLQTCSSHPNLGRGWLPLPKRRSVTQSSRESMILLQWKRKWKLSASLPLRGHPCQHSMPKWLPHHLSNALSTGRAKRPFVQLPASHLRKLFAAAVRNTKGPVKAAAPVIQPAAAQSAAGPSRPETPRKRRHVPSFTAPGPTRRQVLVSFGKGLAPNLDVARLHNTVNQALTTAHAKVAVLSSGPAYDSYSLTTSQVANIKDLEIIRGAVAPFLPTGLQYWVSLPTSTSKSSTFRITQTLSTRSKPPSPR